MALGGNSSRPGFSYSNPGVYLEEISQERLSAFSTGVPAFVGFSSSDSAEQVQIHALSRWEEFDRRIPSVLAGGFLRSAVEGFFQNGGQNCVVVAVPGDRSTGARPEPDSFKDKLFQAFRRLGDVKQLEIALRELTAREEALLRASIESMDLICVPDLALYEQEDMVKLQRDVLRYCAGRNAVRSSCFAILDSGSSENVQRAANHRRSLISPEGKQEGKQEEEPSLKDAALYFPWIWVAGEPGMPSRLVPPCGHVAGVYARVDSRVGVHKAPANEIVEGAVDLGVSLSDEDQGKLNEVGVNCLRSFPGRGIRVWGARTLSGQEEWRYINVRRLIITFERWIDSACADLVFEPTGPVLWKRIRDRLKNCCYTLFQSGALKGVTPAEAFYVKCDAETNPLEEQEAGRVVSEIGFAAVRPAEFIVVKIIQSTTGTRLEASMGPQLRR